jgi:hypothetical protein
MSESGELLSRLNGRRFYQDHLTAVGIPSDTVINYERKLGLSLVSAPPGRGRARQFCLADVYMLKLATEIFVLTGSAIAGVETANNLMYEREEDGKIFSKRNDDEYRLMVEQDIFAAYNPVFTQRTFIHYYLWSIAPRNGFFLTLPGERFDPIRDRDLTRHRMAFINVTQTLKDLDQQLDHLLQAEFGDQYT